MPISSPSHLPLPLPCPQPGLFFQDWEEISGSYCYQLPDSTERHGRFLDNQESTTGL